MQVHEALQDLECPALDGLLTYDLVLLAVPGESEAMHISDELRTF